MISAPATRIKTILVDDEKFARLSLRQSLAAHEHVEIVGECGDADEALQRLEHCIRRVERLLPRLLE